MNQADYLGVVNEMHLSNGLPWSIPITLSISSEQAATLKEGMQVALVNAQGLLQASLTIDEHYGYSKQLEASKVYRTLEEAHPGVKALYSQGDILLGGPVRIVALQQQALPGTVIRQRSRAGCCGAWLEARGGLPDTQSCASRT